MERARETDIYRALAELLPSMIDGFGPCAPLSLWSESMSPEECYYFMYGVPFDFIIGGRERPAEPEPEPEPAPAEPELLPFEPEKPFERISEFSVMNVAEQGGKPYWKVPG